MSWLPSMLVLVQVATPPLDPARQAQRDFASRLHEEGRHAEAAAQLEQLLAQPGADPTLAFDAGQSRMAAGHRAHAWRHFNRYIDTPGLSADDRAAGESRLRAAEVGTTPVTLIVTPGDASARVAVQRFGTAPQERPPLDAALAGGSVAVRLDPGPWEVRVEAEGFTSLVQRVDVGDQPMSLVLELQKATPPVSPESQPATPPVEPAPQRPSGRGEVLAGAVLVPLGLAALGGLIGVGAAHGRTRAAFDPLQAKFDQGLCLADEVLRLEALQGAARRQEAAMIGLGVASAVLIGTGVGLLVHGRARAKGRVALGLRPGLTGLTLTGRF